MRAVSVTLISQSFEADGISLVRVLRVFGDWIGVLALVRILYGFDGILSEE